MKDLFSAIQHLEDLLPAILHRLPAMLSGLRMRHRQMTRSTDCGAPRPG
jgi:hypothetical protein